MRRVWVTRQRGDQPVLPGEQPDAAQRRTRALIERRTHTQRVEQRQIAGGDAFAADLAAREQAFFHHGDRPPRLRKQDRSAGARDTRADDERVVVVLFHRARLAENRWLKKPAVHSRARHSLPDCGHSADNS